MCRCGYCGSETDVVNKVIGSSEPACLQCLEVVEDLVKTARGGRTTEILPVSMAESYYEMAFNLLKMKTKN